MKNAGIPGYFTNHSLRATATTRLYDAQVDEATIMERTGHRSSDGVRAYKRSSEKLKELSSNVLNKKVNIEEKFEPTPAATGTENKPFPESSVSGMQFANSSNFTINFNFH